MDLEVLKHAVGDVKLLVSVDILGGDKLHLTTLAALFNVVLTRVVEKRWRRINGRSETLRLNKYRVLPNTKCVARLLAKDLTEQRGG